jgi:hypothetical protein
LLQAGFAVVLYASEEEKLKSKRTDGLHKVARATDQTGF